MPEMRWQPLTANAQLNAKYGKFWVVVYSPAQIRFIASGKSFPTIEKALKACAKREKANPTKIYGVDVKVPNAR